MDSKHPAHFKVLECTRNYFVMIGMISSLKKKKNQLVMKTTAFFFFCNNIVCFTIDLAIGLYEINIVVYS